MYGKNKKDNSNISRFSFYTLLENSRCSICCGSIEDVKELNDKYNVTEAENVFKKTSDPKDILKHLKDKSASLDISHNSWYWQLDKDSKEYKDYVSMIEKEKQNLQKQIQAQEALIAKLEQRQERVPEGTFQPNLELRNFKTHPFGC